MFCPECKAEYRPGFTHCADCDVDLVDELPPEPLDTKTSAGDSLDGRELELRVIWKGHDQATCVEVCRDLMKADIPYRVAEIAEDRDAGMNVKWRYQIGVLPSDYEQARDAARIEGDFEHAADNHDEEPAAENDSEEKSPESLPEHDSLPHPEVRSTSYLDSWYPEDATVEVWSGNDEGNSAHIERSLRENLIRSRLDVSDDARRIFVLPDDEVRARHILREIVEGVPPV